MTDDSKIKSQVVTQNVLLVTLNNPIRRNAIDREMSDLFAAEIYRFSRDPALKVLVLTGEGTAFCSGSDVHGFRERIEQSDATVAGPIVGSPSVWASLDPGFAERERRELDVEPEIIRLLYGLEKPSIAAVNGPAYGLGCGVALTCDLRVVSDRATFCETFVNRGLVPGDGSTWQLPKLVGLANALWIQYLGDPVDAVEAHRIGMVNRVVRHDDLLEQALDIALRLAQGPPVALGLIKQLLYQGFGQSFSEHTPLAKRANAIARQTQDYREGVTAFLERRPPKFVGI